MAVRCAPRSCPVTPANTRFPVPLRRRPRFRNSTVRLGRMVAWPPCTLLKGGLSSLHRRQGRVQSTVRNRLQSQRLCPHLHCVAESSGAHAVPAAGIVCRGRSCMGYPTASVGQCGLHTLHSTPRIYSLYKSQRLTCYWTQSLAGHWLT